MIRWRRIVWGIRDLSPMLRNDAAAQLVEFAVSLPLLVVFVVGIFDFSNAFTLKQKLTNIARDAARAAAVDPTNDLATSTPVSVTDAFHMVDDFLIAQNINDCGLTWNSTPAGLTWTFTGTGNGCATGGITVIVNRGYYYPSSGATLPNLTCTSQSIGATQMAVISTCVSIQYAYPWRFGKVASLLGSNTTLPTMISGAAVAMNEN
ncbi:MAG TPA: TadE family protein [Candidatus Sulfotelmatobacter sp.]|nr:TadE family protein [Candidatus Sulfotelmatobacter sp.]